MYTYHANVVRVIDGDTLVLDIDLGCHIWLRGEHCRLFGIDTAEVRTRNPWHKAHGLAAKAFVEDLLPRGRKVRVRTHLDRSGKYGRLLVDVDVPERNATLTQLLLAGGFEKRAQYGEVTERLES